MSAALSLRASGAGIMRRVTSTAGLIALIILVMTLTVIWRVSSILTTMQSDAMATAERSINAVEAALAVVLESAEVTLDRIAEVTAKDIMTGQLDGTAASLDAVLADAPALAGAIILSRDDRVIAAAAPGTGVGFSYTGYRFVDDLKGADAPRYALGDPYHSAVFGTVLIPVSRRVVTLDGQAVATLAVGVRQSAIVDRLDRLSLPSARTTVWLRDGTLLAQSDRTVEGWPAPSRQMLDPAASPRWTGPALSRGARVIGVLADRRLPLSAVVEMDPGSLQTRAMINVAVPIIAAILVLGLVAVILRQGATRQREASRAMNQLRAAHAEADAALRRLSASHRALEEERARRDAFIHLAGIRLMEFNASGRLVIDVSGATAGPLRASPADLGRPLQYFIDSVAPAYRHEVEARLRRGEQFRDLTCEVTQPDRCTTILTIQGTPIIGDGGMILGWRLVLANSTAAVRQQVAIAELRAALDSKNQTIRLVAHELRQPAQALTLFSALARDDHSAKTELLTLIHDSALSLASMINEFGRPRRVPVSLRPFLKRLCAVAGGPAASAGPLILQRVPEVTVYTDPSVLERLIVILLANAVRFAASGKVLVGVRRRAPDIRIDVIDTGPGILPDHQIMIVAGWESHDHLPPGGWDGSGIGLAMAQRLARSLGGTLSLASRPNHGTRVSVTLPAS